VDLVILAPSTLSLGLRYLDGCICRVFLIWRVWLSQSGGQPFRVQRHLYMCIHPCILCKTERICKGLAVMASRLRTWRWGSYRKATNRFCCTIFFGQKGEEFSRTEKSFLNDTNTTNIHFWREWRSQVKLETHDDHDENGNRNKQPKSLSSL